MTLTIVGIVRIETAVVPVKDLNYFDIYIEIKNMVRRLTKNDIG